jgi:digeranylgeranylglycerophospholipid reductase
MTQTDILIAGGGFAGLACAKALAQRGISVTVLERKKAPGVGMHTTGIIVKECADEFALPDRLVRKVTDVRLFAPSLKHIDLKSPDYFFLTTDTPALMRHLSEEAEKSGAKILYDTPYVSGKLEGERVVVFTSPVRGEVASAKHEREGVTISDDTPSQPLATLPPNGGENFSSRFLIGADGPRSKVADDFRLGQNTKFLLGAEAEYTGLPLDNPNAFYCFLDQRIAHGYLGWVIPSVGVTQVGLATRMPTKPDINVFVNRMRGIFDFSNANVAARRGGLIPCGGLVEPFARGNVILLGDSAGIVSPLTAGGIHTALHYGKILGKTLADFLHHGGEHPAQTMARIYPRFYFKQGLRKGFEITPNWLLNFTLTNRLFKSFAGQMFFRKKRLASA